MAKKFDASVLQPIWKKAEVRNGYEDECRCVCHYTCGDHKVVSTGAELIQCLAAHFVTDCGHSFGEDGQCSDCEVNKLEHRVRVGL